MDCDREHRLHRSVAGLHHRPVGGPVVPVDPAGPAGAVSAAGRRRRRHVRHLAHVGPRGQPVGERGQDHHGEGGRGVTREWRLNEVVKWENKSTEFLFN